MSIAASRFIFCVSALAVLVALALNIVRIVRQYDEIGGAYESQTMGMYDFHNGIYTPTRAYIDGVNPYGQIILELGYPMARPSPSYGPSHFLIHLPIALLPLRVAEVVYAIITLLAYFLIVAIPVCEHISYESREPEISVWKQSRFWICSFLGLTALLLSRPGHVNFVTAYFTAELVLGTIATLFLASRHPVWAGMAFILVCGKPTYAIPLVCVLFILGLYRALAASILAGGIANAIALVWLLRFDSLSGLLAGIREGQAQHMDDPIGMPSASWVRIDWTAIVSKWMHWDPTEVVQLGVMAVLYLSVWAILLKRRNLRPLHSMATKTPFVSTAVATLFLSSILLFLYHHVYDAMLLVPASVALILNQLPWVRSMSTFRRIAVLVLVTSPFWNYLSSESFLGRLPDIVWLRYFLTSWNCIGVTVGAILILSAAGREISEITHPNPA